MVKNAGPDIRFPDKEHIKRFEYVFKSNFKSLVSYACSIVKDEIVAEELVQNVFCKLWERNPNLDIRETIGGYLYRAVYYESLNYFKHQKVRDVYEAHALAQNASVADTTFQLQYDELETRFNQALNQLPERCRTVFQMCRFEELRYQEIAQRLDIPVKTVENQMGKALRLLRLHLSEFLIFAFVVIFTASNIR